LTEAEAQGLKIKYVIETHLHADFVSGHRELSARTGAEIVFGEKARARFPHRAVKDGDELSVGKVVLRVLETPGHTPESISVVVSDNEVSDAPQKVLTGDTLFIGDVGRPDLAGARGYTPQAMAALMYESLHEKLLKLEDSVEVWPAHGAGSMCGRNISKETHSTIGEQRRFNYALAPMSKDDFVRMMTSDIPEPPAYFPADAEINRTGAPSLDELPRPAALMAQQVAAYANLGYVILDVRTAEEFGAGHVPGALNIGLGGQFASWAGALIPLGTPIIIVATSDEQIDEALTRLARVGHETVRGYLRGGMDEWRASGLNVSEVPQVTVAELSRMLDERADLQVLDVRRPAEYAAGHAPRAESAPLSPRLKDEVAQLDPARPVAVICAGGYRSSAATSMLKPLGFRQLLNVTGGTGAWIAAGFPVEKPSATI
jgi:glyoxylase-like metal-dependent hydrolase (beta-lactamase superfamily II)/rhodanese-related sulfurtransferase